MPNRYSRHQPSPPAPVGSESILPGSAGPIFTTGGVASMALAVLRLPSQCRKAPNLLPKWTAIERSVGTRQSALLAPGSTDRPERGRQRPAASNATSEAVLGRPFVPDDRQGRGRHPGAVRELADHGCEVDQFGGDGNARSGRMLSTCWKSWTPVSGSTYMAVKCGASCRNLGRLVIRTQSPVSTRDNGWVCEAWTLATTGHPTVTADTPDQGFTPWPSAPWWVAGRYAGTRAALPVPALG
jgi:hypothetical protein